MNCGQVYPEPSRLVCISLQTFALIGKAGKREAHFRIRFAKFPKTLKQVQLPLLR